MSSLVCVWRAEGSPYAVPGSVSMPGVAGVAGADDPPPPLSPDPALTVLQPAPGASPPPATPTPAPHEPAALYPTMLPSFTHYVTTGEYPRRCRPRCTGGAACERDSEYAYSMEPRGGG